MNLTLEQTGADVAQMLARLDPRMPIGSTVVLQVQKSKEGVFEKKAAALTDATSKLPGCRIFGFHRHQSVFPTSSSGPVQYLIYEEWDSVQHFTKQWLSKHLRNFQTTVLDLLTAPVDLNFYTTTSGSGRPHVPGPRKQKKSAAARTKAERKKERPQHSKI